MGECTPETPVKLTSHVVDCLTMLEEDESLPLAVRATCHDLRDGAVNVLLDLQTALPRAAADGDDPWKETA